MEHKVLEQEKSHLKSVQQKLIESKNFIEDGMKALGDKNLETLKDLRENRETNGADLFFFIEQLDEQNKAFNIKDKYQRLEEIKSLLKETYFARLNLKDPVSKIEEAYYIGKFGFTDDKPEVIDWRAKVASVYYRYRYPQNGVTYDTPDGLVTKDLTLKRSFEMDNGDLIKYFNNDIQLDESQILNSKLEKRTGGVLEDIVETIQESQLNIIEADPRQISIVQGCVGSGKSTVAIHKLSHIFFNFPELIHPERSILIAKNQILVGYLSTLFPKLGIFDINYKTLKDLLVNIVFGEGLRIKYDFSLGTDITKYNIKTHELLHHRLRSIAEKYDLEMTELLETKEFESFAGYVYNYNQTPYQNYSECIAELEEEIDIQQYNLTEHAGSSREMLWKDNVKTLKKLINKLKKIRTTIKETTLLEIIKELKINHHSKLGYYETLLYTYVYSEVVGIEAIRKFEYCVVDEGQDFGLLEFAVLSKAVINGRFCILGDLNQSYQNEGLTKWEDISQVIREAKNAQTFELDTNYRSTKQIIEFANTILKPYTEKYLPKSINRVGLKPMYEVVESSLDAVEKTKNLLKSELANLDKSIGIICYDIDAFTELDKFLTHMNLPEDQYVKLDPSKKISYLPKGLYLTKFEDCKGLEFSKVYVLGNKLSLISTYTEAKKYFVASTRAMNELVIFDVK